MKTHSGEPSEPATLVAPRSSRGFHPTWLLYTVMLALALNIVLGVLQAMLTDGPAAALSLDNLRRTYVGRFATAQPALAGLFAIAAVVTFILGWRLDRHFTQEKIRHDERELDNKIDQKVEKKLPKSEAIPVTLAKDLDPTDFSFKMGAPDEATFPYITEPIQAQYDQAVRALRDASQGRAGARRGILILGYAGAGKTRLAIEALKAALPDWLVLNWNGAANQTLPSLVGHNYVVFVDDLQLIANAPSANGLRAVLQVAQGNPQRKVLVVATCRKENAEEAEKAEAFGWLFEMLERIELPRFSNDRNDLKTRRIIQAFAEHGAKYAQDWDGTIGSLVLDVARKREQYSGLGERHPAAVTVLQAMKLMSLSGTTLHTESRIRAVCAEVFAQPALRDDERIWQDAVNALTRYQFVDEVQPDVQLADDVLEQVRQSLPDGASLTLDQVRERLRGPVRLAVRSDAYFDKVILDYPPPDRQSVLPRQRAQLQQVYVGLRDADALLDLARSFLNAGSYGESVGAIEQAILAQPTDFTAYSALNLGYLLNQRGAASAARTAYERIIAHAEEAGRALAEVYLAGLLAEQGARVEAEAAGSRALQSGYASPVEVAIALGGDEPDALETVRRAFLASRIYALGRPAGDIEGNRGSQSDVLHFTIDDPSGAEMTMLPVYTRAEIMRESLLRNPEWQTLGVLEIEASALADNVDPDVAIVINPWSPLEFQFPARDPHAVSTGPRMPLSQS